MHSNMKRRNWPVDVVQSVVPQAQSFEFTTDPSVLVHASIAAVLEHELDDDWQNRPPSVSHILVPHIQSDGLTVPPSVLEQALMHEITIFSSCQPAEVYAFIGVGDGDESSGFVTLFIQYIDALVDPSVGPMIHLFEFQYKLFVPNLYAGLPPEFDPIHVYVPNLDTWVVDPEAARSNVAHGDL